MKNVITIDLSINLTCIEEKKITKQNNILSRNRFKLF